jgi:hypothetical protein
MKDHAQTATQRELLEAEQCGPRGEPCDGDRPFSPRGTNLVQPQLRDIGIGHRLHLRARARKARADTARCGVAPIDEDSMDIRAKGRYAHCRCGIHRACGYDGQSGDGGDL